jgi:hypothetical protein
MDSGDLHELDVRISALEAELQRRASGAANSGSEVRADAGSRRLQAVVRPNSFRLYQNITPQLTGN